MNKKSLPIAIILPDGQYMNSTLHGFATALCGYCRDFIQELMRYIDVRRTLPLYQGWQVDFCLAARWNH